MTIGIKELLKELSPEQRKEYEEELLGFAIDCINDLKELNPQKAERLIAKLKPRIRLLEQRLAWITPEDRQKLRELLNQRPSKEDQ
ncbi:hypothetical protein [Candidatus Chlorohelix sp.]|uniref:hypothetical protein n=1 Tax=Candidatus Chlorohelix sp. TaxID=3139201 RepID=UPI00304DDFFF